MNATATVTGQKSCLPASRAASIEKHDAWLIALTNGVRDDKCRLLHDETSIEAIPDVSTDVDTTEDTKTSQVGVPIRSESALICR